MKKLALLALFSILSVAAFATNPSVTATTTITVNVDDFIGVSADQAITLHSVALGAASVSSVSYTVTTNHVTGYICGAATLATGTPPVGLHVSTAGTTTKGTNGQGTFTVSASYDADPTGANASGTFTTTYTVVISEQ